MVDGDYRTHSRSSVLSVFLDLPQENKTAAGGEGGLV